MTNEIMNLNCFQAKESNENYQKNNNIKLKLSQNNKNIISDKYNDLKQNKNEESNNILKNKDKLDDKMNELIYHDDINLCGNKKLDETTKNTINNILEFVLNEMKSNKGVK